MDYFCLGNSFDLVKKRQSNAFFNKISLISASRFTLLPVTEEIIIDAFMNSEQLIICLTLADALKLRTAKIDIDNSDATIATRDRPARDYAIYKVTISEDIGDQFDLLTKKTVKQLKSLISFQLWYGAEFLNEYSAIPNIAVLLIKKAAFTVNLVSSHYFSPIDGHEQIVVENQSRAIANIY